MLNEVHKRSDGRDKNHRPLGKEATNFQFIVSTGIKRSFDKSLISVVQQSRPLFLHFFVASFLKIFCIHLDSNLDDGVQGKPTDHRISSVVGAAKCILKYHFIFVTICRERVCLFTSKSHFVRPD